MKVFRLSFLLYALTPLCLTLGPVQSASRASSGAGDKQFSFTRNERGGQSTFAMGDSAARYRAEQEAREAARGGTPREEPEKGYPVAPETPPPSSARQQAGQTGNQISTTTRDRRDGMLMQSGRSALKDQEQNNPGQLSNIPGTSSSSPNGTGNLYGTNGLPIFPGDILDQDNEGTVNVERNENP